MVNGLTILGAVAAACTTLAFVPQIQKILKTGGQDLSYPMLGLYLMGVSLWLGYGLALGAAALCWANAVSIVFVGACISVKWMKERAIRRANGEPRKLRIAIDMDETIANSLKEHVVRFNAAFGANLAEDELYGSNIEDLVPVEQRAAVRGLVNDGSFF
jgi:MtN3 and saliva related transmembrane protein